MMTHFNCLCDCFLFYHSFSDRSFFPFQLFQLYCLAMFMSAHNVRAHVYGYMYVCREMITNRINIGTEQSKSQLNLNNRMWRKHSKFVQYAHVIWISSIGLVLQISFFFIECSKCSGIFESKKCKHLSCKSKGDNRSTFEILFQ